MNGLTDSDIEDDFGGHESNQARSSPPPSTILNNNRMRKISSNRPDSKPRTKSTRGASPLRVKGSAARLHSPPSQPTRVPPDIPSRQRQRTYNPFDEGSAAASSGSEDVEAPNAAIPDLKGPGSLGLSQRVVPSASPKQRLEQSAAAAAAGAPSSREVVFSSRPALPGDFDSAWKPPTAEAVAHMAAAPRKPAAFFQSDDDFDEGATDGDASHRRQRQQLRLSQDPPPDKRGAPPMPHQQARQASTHPAASNPRPRPTPRTAASSAAASAAVASASGTKALSLEDLVESIGDELNGVYRSTSRAAEERATSENERHNQRMRITGRDGAAANAALEDILDEDDQAMHYAKRLSPALDPKFRASSAASSSDNSPLDPDALAKFHMHDSHKAAARTRRLFAAEQEHNATNGGDASGDGVSDNGDLPQHFGVTQALEDAVRRNYEELGRTHGSADHQMQQLAKSLNQHSKNAFHDQTRGMPGHRSDHRSNTANTSRTLVAQPPKPADHDPMTDSESIHWGHAAGRESSPSSTAEVQHRLLAEARKARDEAYGFRYVAEARLGELNELRAQRADLLEQLTRKDSLLDERPSPAALETLRTKLEQAQQELQLEKARHESDKQHQRKLALQREAELESELAAQGAFGSVQGPVGANVSNLEHCADSPRENSALSISAGNAVAEAQRSVVEDGELTQRVLENELEKATAHARDLEARNAELENKVASLEKAREIGLLKIAEERADLRAQVQRATQDLQSRHERELEALRRDFEARQQSSAQQLSRIEDDAHIQKQALQNDQKLRMLDSMKQLHVDNAKLVAAAVGAVGGSPRADVQKIQRVFEKENANLRAQLAQLQATVRQKSAECVKLAESAQTLAAERDGLQRDFDALEEIARPRGTTSSGRGKVVPVSRIMRSTRRVLELCNNMMHAWQDVAMRVRLRSISASGSGEADRLDSAVELLSDQIDAHFAEMERRYQLSRGEPGRTAAQSPQHGVQASVVLAGSPRGRDVSQSPAQSPRSPRSPRSPQLTANHDEELRQSMQLVRRCVEREKTFSDQLQMLEQSHREQQAVLEEEVRGLRQQLTIQRDTEAMLLSRLYQYESGQRVGATADPRSQSSRQTQRQAQRPSDSRFEAGGQVYPPAQLDFTPGYPTWRQQPQHNARYSRTPIASSPTHL